MKKYLLALFFATLCSLAFAQTARKTAVAVMDLRGSGLSETDAKFLTERLIIELQRTDVFDVLERDKMSEILKEQGFQQTGACDQTSCLVEAGRMLPVQKMIGGSVGKLGETFSVQIRLIDLRTARVEKTATQDCNQKMDYLLTDEMKFIANDISGKIVPLGGGSDGNQPIKQNIVYRYQLGVFSIGRLDKFSNGIRNEIEIPDSIKNQLSNGAWGWFGLIVPGGTFYPAHKPLHGLIFLAAEGALIYWANTDGSSPESPGLLFLELHLGQWIWGMVELGKYNKKILGKNYKLAFNVYPEEVNIKTAIVLNF